MARMMLAMSNYALSNILHVPLTSDSIASENCFKLRSCILEFHIILSEGGMSLSLCNVPLVMYFHSNQHYSTCVSVMSVINLALTIPQLCTS
jgi:hypothetical protein